MFMWPMFMRMNISPRGIAEIVFLRSRTSPLSPPALKDRRMATFTRGRFRADDEYSPKGSREHTPLARSVPTVASVLSYSPKGREHTTIA